MQAQPSSVKMLKADEYDVRAALLLNIAKFIFVPDDDEASNGYGVCIAGRGELVDSFKTVFEQKKVRGKMVDLHAYESSHLPAACHLVYIGPSKIHQLPGILEQAAGHRVLTVSEYSPAAIKECMVVFRIVDDKLKLYISQNRIRAAGLEVSSALLNVAENLDPLGRP